MIGTRRVMLPDSSLKLLLQLVLAREGGGAVHKRELGASDDQGFKGVSVLREWLKPALDEGVDIIDNDYHGFYSLAKRVSIVSCDAERLAEIGDPQIADLAARISRQLTTRRQKSEGNS